MLSKFLKRPGKNNPRSTIEPGRRVYAIGDIHGCDDLLAQLLDQIDRDDDARGPAETTIIILGDLVDRGPDSAAVVERLRLLKQARPAVRLLMGNHEEILLAALAGDDKALRLFARIGGRETLMSYGIDDATYDRLDYPDLHRSLIDNIPSSHRQFIETFEDLIEIGGYAFVHAGIDPRSSLDQQRTRDLRWIREPFLSFPRPLDKMVVHGHTISDAVQQRAHRIGIDTGAYMSGTLTALGLEGDQRWFLYARQSAQADQIGSMLSA